MEKRAHLSTGTVGWSFAKPAGSKLSPDPTATAQSGNHEFELWAPLPAAGSYTPELAATLSLNGKPLATETDEVLAHPPLVSLKASDAKLAADGTFTASITAAASRLCGDPARYTWSWHQPGGRKVSWTGPGPHPVSLKPGENATYGVSVADQWGVEKIKTTLLLVSPQLRVQTQASCAQGASAASDYRLQPGWTSGAKIPGSTLCADTRVSASVQALAPGVDAVFAEATLGRVTYAWSNLQVAPAGSKAWQEVPAGWKVAHPDRELSIAPDKLVEYQFQAIVTATDQPPTGNQLPNPSTQPRRAARTVRRHDPFPSARPRDAAMPLLPASSGTH